MNKIKQLAPFALLILALGIVGKMDFDDYIDKEKRKCEYDSGAWVAEKNGDQYCK